MNLMLRLKLLLLILYFRKASVILIRQTKLDVPTYTKCLNNILYSKFILMRKFDNIIKIM